MKRSTVLILILGAALVLVPVFQLRAQQRHSRYGRSSDSTQQGETGNSRESRFSGYGGYQRTESSVQIPLPGKPLPADFEILISKSIFDKDRRPRSSADENRTGSADSRPAPVVVRPPSVPVLIGVILGDDDYIAYIEDPETSKLWPFAVGDTLPGNYGTVRQVSIDGIEIVRDSAAAPQRILIGQNLKGETAELPPLSDTSLSSTPRSTPGSAATTAPASTLPAGAGDLTIEQRMKLRRLQQVGQ